MNFSAARLSKIRFWSKKKIAIGMNLMTLVGEIILGIYWVYALNWSGTYPYQPYIIHLLAPAVIGLAALFILIVFVWLGEPAAITTTRENIDGSTNAARNKSETNNNPTPPPPASTTRDANTTNPPSIDQNHSTKRRASSSYTNG